MIAATSAPALVPEADRVETPSAAAPLTGELRQVVVENFAAAIVASYRRRVAAGQVEQSKTGS